MRAESTRVCEVAEHPADRQHANQRNQTDDADRNIALGDRQRVRFAGLARTRSGHRAGKALRDWLDKLQQCPDRRNADRACAEETDFFAPSALRELAGGGREIAHQPRVVRHSPTPADKRANEHGDADRQTHQVTDREQRERKREIIAAHRAPLADSKRLRHISSEYLRCNDDREERGNN